MKIKKFDFDRAKALINDRSEEATRKNGPFEQGMERAAAIVSGSFGLESSAPQMYLNLVALKLSRLSYSLRGDFENYHEDHIFDSICYLAGLHNYIMLHKRKIQQEEEEKKLKLDKELDKKLDGKIAHIEAKIDNRCKLSTAKKNVITTITPFIRLCVDIIKNGTTIGTYTKRELCCISSTKDSLKKKTGLNIYYEGNKRLNTGGYTVPASQLGELEQFVLSWFERKNIPLPGFE